MLNFKKTFLIGLFLWPVLFFSFSQARLNVDSLGNYKFPNASFLNTNEVWGYVDSNGTEYALVGRGNGFSVISLADPRNPNLVYSDTSSISLWRDIKSWNGYAYVVNEDRGGLEIFDLRALPDSVRKVGSYFGETFSLETAHNLYIDSNGVAYIFGTNNNQAVSAGTIFLDLTEPESPTELGNFDSLYLHDGYVRDNILYGGAVNDGIMVIINVEDKTDPLIIGSKNTPSSFTHNVWLSDDSQTAFTTDEKSAAFITSYDISNPASIVELDRIRTRNTTNVIPHNTHVLNDFLVTSYYTAGVSIVDASNPDNLIEVGYFDTSPASGDGFFGNWGAYPFLPSGLLLATDMQEGLFVLQPNYKRAAFLEVFLNNCDGSSIGQAKIKLVGLDSTVTNLVGQAEIGGLYEGFFTLSVEAPGYYPELIDSVELISGNTNRLSIVLRDSNNAYVNIISNAMANKLENAIVQLDNGETVYTANSNQLGIAKFEDLPFGDYEARVGALGYENNCFETVSYNCQNDTSLYLLSKGLEDNFEMDFGWTVSGNESRGAWTRAKPIGTVDQIYVANPAIDVVSDCGERAFVTGNGLGNADRFDVDSTTILTSPHLNLNTYIDPFLVYSYWFYDGGTNADDRMLVQLIDTADQIQTIDTIQREAGLVNWKIKSIELSKYLDKQAFSKLRFSISDGGAPNVLEAGIDNFFVSEGEYIGLNELTKEEALKVYPNPFNEEILIESNSTEIESIRFLDLQGRELLRKRPNGKRDRLTIDQDLAPSIYFLNIRLQDGSLITKKLIKQ